MCLAGHQTKVVLYLAERLRLLFAVPSPTKEDQNSPSEWEFPEF